MNKSQGPFLAFRNLIRSVECAESNGSENGSGGSIMRPMQTGTQPIIALDKPIALNSSGDHQWSISFLCRSDVESLLVKAVGFAPETATGAGRLKFTPNISSYSVIPIAAPIGSPAGSPKQGNLDLVIEPNNEGDFMCGLVTMNCVVDLVFYGTIGGTTLPEQTIARSVRLDFDV